MKCTIGAGLALSMMAWCATAQVEVQPGVSRPAARCAALLSLRLDDTVLAEAVETEAGEVPANSGSAPGAGRLSLPSHCLVRGEVNRHKGLDGEMYGIRFELRMPNAWQGRMLFLGGGGLDGVVQPALGIEHVGAGLEDTTALTRGYAVVSDDGGHTTAQNTSFGLDPQARADYDDRSTRLVAAIALQLMKSFYGETPRYRYFQGCSNGGREGLKTAQSFPDLFDGVIAGAPAFRLTHAAVAQAWSTDQLARIAPVAADGIPDLRQSLTAADLRLLSDAVLAKCDALDGLKDGLIFNQSACHFDPESVVCRQGQVTPCLPAEKVNVVKQIFAGPHTSVGRALYSEWPYDSGISAEGWRAWITGNATTESINVLIFPTFFNKVALAGAPPPIDIFHFDFDTDPQRIAKMSPEIDVTSADWALFRKKKGKLLLYTGESDPVFSATDLIRYYRQVEASNGGEQEARTFARLFISPGMNHCAGGAALDNFDTLTAMEKWVEQGIAPESLQASGSAFPGRSRPLCSYPRVAFYDEHGDPQKSSSFQCRVP